MFFTLISFYGWNWDTFASVPEAIFGLEGTTFQHRHQMWKPGYLTPQRASPAQYPLLHEKHTSLCFNQGYLDFLSLAANTKGSKRQCFHAHQVLQASYPYSDIFCLKPPKSNDLGGSVFSLHSTAKGELVFSGSVRFLSFLGLVYVFISQGCPNKVPQTGWLTQVKFIFSQFRRLEAGDQGRLGFL